MCVCACSVLGQRRRGAARVCDRAGLAYRKLLCVPLRELARPMGYPRGEGPRGMHQGAHNSVWPMVCQQQCVANGVPTTVSGQWCAHHDVMMCVCAMMKWLRLRCCGVSHAAGASPWSSYAPQGDIEQQRSPGRGQAVGIKAPPGLGVPCLPFPSWLVVCFILTLCRRLDLPQWTRMAGIAGAHVLGMVLI